MDSTAKMHCMGSRIYIQSRDVSSKGSKRNLQDTEVKTDSDNLVIAPTTTQLTVQELAGSAANAVSCQVELKRFFAEQSSCATDTNGVIWGYIGF